MNDSIQALTEDQTCPATGYQSVSVCVPVTVTPYARTGATYTKCCGNPVVTPGPQHLRRHQKRNLLFHHQPGYLCSRAGFLRRSRIRGRHVCGLQRRLCRRYLHRLRQGNPRYSGSQRALKAQKGNPGLTGGSPFCSSDFGCACAFDLQASRLFTADGLNFVKELLLSRAVFR